MGEILDKQKTDLELSQFAILSAIKGTQFGKDVYSSVIKFNDLADFLSVFPEVQRDIIPRKVASIRRYILSGLEDGNSMRFFSAVTVTCRATIYYDEKNHRCAIDTHNSKLSVNDGQHRFEAIKTLIEQLEKDFLKSKDKARTVKLKSMIDELKEMVIPIVVFDGLNEIEESQLFHDLNNLAQRPSRNANIRLNQTDFFSKMAIQLSKENRYLSHYGVETDKMSISGKNNKNTILLSTIYASIKELLNSEYKANHGFLNEENFDDYKTYVNDTFDKLFYALPHDMDTRGKYLLEKSFAIKTIAKFIRQSRQAEMFDDEIFNVINKVDWTNNIDTWSKYGAISGYRNGNIVFGGGNAGGVKAVLSMLNDNI